jgi:hypothetical protein
MCHFIEPCLTISKPSLDPAIMRVAFGSAEQTFSGIPECRFPPGSIVHPFASDAPSGAVSIASRVWDPYAYGMAIRWLLRQIYPRRFSLIARKVVLGMILALHQA